MPSEGMTSMRITSLYPMEIVPCSPHTCLLSACTSATTQMAATSRSTRYASGFRGSSLA